MTHNKIVQIFIVALVLLIGVWASITTVTLEFQLQIIALVCGVLITALVLIKWRLPVDYKFLCFILWGYALAGKGFAYLTPFEPVYVGEIALVLCALGLLLRIKRLRSFADSPLIWLVFGWMVIVGLYLMVGFEEFRLNAIRDSVIGYYALFTLAACVLFQSEDLRVRFGGVLKFAMFLSFISCFLVVSGIAENFIMPYPTLEHYFSPHPDAYIPLVVAGTTFAIISGLARRSPLKLALGMLGIALLLLTKTAGIFCLLTTIIALTVFTRRIELLFVSVGTVMFAGLAIAILIAADLSFIRERVMQSDQIQTLTDLGNTSGKGTDSTSDWRITWWTIIVEDTLKTNPVFGSGMGSDVTSGFIEAAYGKTELSRVANYARYPHCILFNVFGRMGFVGLFFFLILFTAVIFFSLRFASLYLWQKEFDDGALIAFSIVFSGMMNGLVQATYEVPHGAILYWTCLGYLIAYHRANFKPAAAWQPLRHASARFGALDA